jgi:fructokinase
MKLYGGIEAGGTKFVCVIAGGPHDVRAELRFPTTSPAETLQRAIAFFKERASELPVAAVGVGAFGPVDLDPASPTFGFITTTPKLPWINTNIVGTLKTALGVPVAMDTDVNVAALGEYRWGAAQNLDPAIYLTVGTGIGGGGIFNGKPMHGLVHPEIGHMRIPHDRQADPFAGACPYHGDCFEGLACGPAIQQRWAQPGETLPDDHPAWELEVQYIALALVNLIVCYSPRRIVIGGGVMRDKLFPSVRRQVQHLLNNYVQAPDIIQNIEGYIVPPALGNQAGMLGAIALAMDAVQR